MAIKGLRFANWWCSMLWDAMSRTGKGYRQPSLKRNGKGERRKDKLERIESKAMRSYRARYT